LSNFAKLSSRIEKVTTRLIEKPMRRKLSKMSLPQQVLYARKIIKTTGVHEMRRNLICGIGDEFHDDIVSGKTPKEVVERYTSCPEFVQFWGELDMNADHLTELAREATEATKKARERVVPTYTVEEVENAKQTLGIGNGKVGRNDPCPCGSGRKYKKCCLGTRE